MRVARWLLAVVAGLVLTSPSWAQRAVTFNGGNALTLAFQPVDTSQSVVPIARPQTLVNQSFRLKDILPKIGLPGSKVTRGQSVFPTPSELPGPNYLKSFQAQRPAPVRIP